MRVKSLHFICIFINDTANLDFFETSQGSAATYLSVTEVLYISYYIIHFISLSSSERISIIR